MFQRSARAGSDDHSNLVLVLMRVLSCSCARAARVSYVRVSVRQCVLCRLCAVCPTERLPVARCGHVPNYSLTPHPTPGLAASACVSYVRAQSCGAWSCKAYVRVVPCCVPCARCAFSFQGQLSSGLLLWMPCGHIPYAMVCDRIIM